jgi:isopenicillin N synthase-like dioxygenase
LEYHPSSARRNQARTMVKMILDVDLDRFEQGSNTQRRAVVDGVMRSLQTGFVYLAHDLPDGLLDDVYGALAEFFTQPAEVKQRYQVPGSFGQSGYTGLLVETAAGAEHADWKEMLNWSVQVPADHPAKRRWPDLYHDPVFPDDVVSGIGLLLSRFHHDVFHLQRRFLRIVADGLSVAPEYFDRLVADHTTLSRALHYPAMVDAPDGEHVWAAPHADINAVTALPRATTRGLQLEMGGEWVDVVAPDGQAVMNTGLMLETLTNGLIPAGVHRVVADGAEERYSIVQFCHPVRGAILSPLPSCVSEQRPLAYPSLSSADALAQVLYDINLRS